MVAEIQKELDILAQKRDGDGVLGKLSLQMRPNKALVVKQKINKDQLVLVPCALKIVQRVLLRERGPQARFYGAVL